LLLGKWIGASGEYLWIVRLSNGFSRKIENYMAAVAINNFDCNFIKIHTSLRTSHAMAAGDRPAVRPDGSREPARRVREKAA
jgi:hypothetical protein